MVELRFKSKKKISFYNVKVSVYVRVISWLGLGYFLCLKKKCSSEGTPWRLCLVFLTKSDGKRLQGG